MISVVIPARNEGESVAAVVRRAARALQGRAFEVLVVDDGSTDDTGAQAAAAGARVVRAEGRGYGAAVKLGAREAKGELLALLDADGSYPEEALPALLAQVEAGARQAIGARPAVSQAESWSRSAVKALFRAWVWWFGGLRVPDLNSGLRVVHAADVRALEALLPDRFSLTTTLTLALASSGAQVAFVDVAYRPRVGRSKWRAVSDTWRMARVVVRGIGWLRQKRAPTPLPSLGFSR